MSDKFHGTEKNGASPQGLRAEVERLMAHVRTHNPDHCQFAITMFGHSDGVEDEDGHKELHVCSLIGGSPLALARAVTDLISELVKRDPAFALVILKSLIADVDNIRRQALEERIDDMFDQIGDERTKATVTDIMSRITKNDGSIH